MKKSTVKPGIKSEITEKSFSPQMIAPISQEKKQWFENESFWQNFGPVMFDSQRWAEAPGIAESVIKIAGLTKGSSVLDAGCGPGRISVELAAKGLDVTGVDIIQSELDAAKDSADAEGVKLDLINCDLRSFKSQKKFDCAINLYTSFGYCDTIEEDFQILKNIAEFLLSVQLDGHHFQILKNIADSLRDNGFFILECTSRETAILYFTDGEWFERSGLTVLTQFSVEGAWEGLRSKWTIINRDGQRIEHEFVQRLYSAIELKRMMIRAGFNSVEIYGNYDFSPYNEHAKTMVIVAKK